MKVHSLISLNCIAEVLSYWLYLCTSIAFSGLHMYISQSNRQPTSTQKCGPSNCPKRDLNLGLRVSVYLNLMQAPTTTTPTTTMTTTSTTTTTASPGNHFSEINTFKFALLF